MNPTAPLFAALPPLLHTEALSPGACILRGHAFARQRELLTLIEAIACAAPFRHLTTPGGFRMSVAMTNCGALGWVADASGYRYADIDPFTQRPWPAMPPAFAQLATHAATAAGYADFRPDACLINRYEPRARLSLHRDYDEKDAAAPIVSVSLGVSAKFLWGGLQRSNRPLRVILEGGDVVVWGGPSRFAYHGVAPLDENLHPLTGPLRFNLTFRKAR